MNLRQSIYAGLLAGVVLLHAILLLVALPKAVSRLHPMYNQEEYADGYDQLAGNLVAGNGYRMYPDTARTMVREPGYPLLLAAIFALWGNNFLIVKLANLMLALGTAWLMTFIARRLSSSPVLIFGAPLLFLFHPGTLVAESRGGVEVLFTFLLTLFVFSVYRAVENPRFSNYLVSGVVLGATVLVKSTPMLFPVGLFFYLALMDRRSSIWKSALQTSAMVMAMLLVLSPWIVRNYSLTGKFIPTATVLGVSAHAGLYVNTHLPADDSWALVDRDGARERRRIAQELGYPFKNVQNAYYQDFYSSMDEVRFSNYLFHMVLDEYKKSPMTFVRCVRANLFNLWFRGKTRNSTLLNIAVQLPYLALAVVGIVLTARSGQVRVAAPILLLLAYMIALYIVILSQARYNVPLVPFLSIFAAITLAAAQRKLGSARCAGAGPEPAHEDALHASSSPA